MSEIVFISSIEGPMADIKAAKGDFLDPIVHARTNEKKSGRVEKNLHWLLNKSKRETGFFRYSAKKPLKAGKICIGEIREPPLILQLRIHIQV